MRVLQLLKTLRRGGAESVALELVRNLNGPDFSFSVAYFLPQGPVLQSDFRALGVDTHCLNASSSLTLPFAIPRLRSLLHDLEIDILHCHLPLPGIAGRLAALGTGVKVVYTEHNLQDRYHPLTRRLNRATWPLQDHVIAVSRQVASTIRVGHKAPPVSVIYNGIPIDRFQKIPSTEELHQLRSSLGLREGPVVGTVAVMREAKRLDRWLLAARCLLESEPSIQFLIVGDGPLEHTIRREADRLELPPSLRFAGAQADIRPYLALMSVFLCSSDYEGLPLAILEAMAVGLPVVAPPAGGIPEAVADGVTGIVSEFSPVELARDVTALLHDATLRQRYGQRAREKAQREFSSARMARDTSSVYVSCASSLLAPTR